MYESSIMEFLDNHKLSIFIMLLLVTFGFGSWYFTEYLPKHKAIEYFTTLESRTGFTKLADVRSYSETKDFLPIGEVVGEFMDTNIAEIKGYTFYNSYTDESSGSKIEMFDEVDIYSTDGKYITTGTYEKYFGVKDSMSTLYKNEELPSFHIISVLAPGKEKKFDREFKIQSNYVVLKKK